MAKKGVLRIKVAGDASNFTKTMQGAIGKLGGFAKAAGKAGAAAAGAFAAVSIKAFGDFDQAMTESLAIMGDVSDEMRKGMSDAAREIAKTTKFSATEAAESYFFLASAGMDAEQSIAALPQVAAFAQAGMFDMATATDLATDAQSALGLASDDAAENLENLTRVTDVFVRANTLANTSVEQISEAMTNKAGAAMRAVGMEIEEGAAVLAAFADQGVKGAEAGTQFSIVLRDLQTRALENVDAFEAAGVAVFDAEGELRNMGDIVSQLEDRLDGMSDAQKKAELATLGFTDKSIAAITTLLGTSDAIRGYEKELRSASGFTADVAAKQMESFKAQMGLLRDRFMDVAITVGSVLAPKLLEAFDSISAWWDANGPGIRQSIRDVAATVVQWWEETARPKVVAFGQAVRMLWEQDVQPVLDQLKVAWVENKDTLGQVVTNMTAILGDLGRTVAVVFGEARTTVDADGRDIATSLGKIADAMERITWWTEKVTSAFDTVASWADTPLGKVARDAYNAMFNLSAAFQNALDTYNKLKRALSGGDSKSVGPAIPRGGGSLVPEGIPQLAHGGIVKARPGGTLANIGEGGEDEAVIPLSKLRGGGGTTIHEHHHHYAPGTDGDDIVRRLMNWTSKNGPAPFPTAS